MPKPIDYYDDRIRQRLEGEVSGVTAEFLAKQKRRLLKQAMAGEAIDWTKENDLLYKMLAPKLNEIAISVAIQSGGEILDPSVLNKKTVDWIRRYFDDMKKINDNTANIVRVAIEDFQNTPGMTRGDLEQMLGRTFDPVRASRIAVTETTRAYSAAERIVGDEYRRLGIQMQDIWNTDNDDLVCEICEPNNDKPYGDGWTDYPPAHVNCRCWITHILKRGDDAENERLFNEITNG